MSQWKAPALPYTGVSHVFNWCLQADQGLYYSSCLDCRMSPFWPGISKTFCKKNNKESRFPSVILLSKCMYNHKKFKNTFCVWYCKMYLLETKEETVTRYWKPRPKEESRNMLDWPWHWILTQLRFYYAVRLIMLRRQGSVGYSVLPNHHQLLSNILHFFFFWYWKYESFCSEKGG